MWEDSPSAQTARRGREVRWHDEAHPGSVGIGRVMLASTALSGLGCRMGLPYVRLRGGQRLFLFPAMAGAPGEGCPR